MDDLFRSPDHLSHAFAAGLAALTESDGIGNFILAAANATFDLRLWERLRPALAEQFAVLADRYRDLLLSGRPLPDAPDDVMVFLKLAHIGFDALDVTDFRHAGPWEVQFNRLRAFRPQRASHQTVDKLTVPFSRQGFHFNKPFLQSEQLWEGLLEGRAATLYYNKFPFVAHHGLLVPERSSEHPQQLTEALHGWLWKVTEQLGDGLPGTGFGYNAYGAHASINHLHFQLFQREAALPIAALHWNHNGGEIAYPARCLAFDSVVESWQAVAGLHTANQTYNLIYLPGRCYLLPRRFQGSFILPEWSAGLSWYELAGGAITFDRGCFDTLSASAISQLIACGNSPV